ncbi:hypothetical protein EB796_019356 [Bugula neritina]|uniref:EF-hand domain-containing protein n=1 Tax=Bugula neritina TaxID=10212 RepID=A0A7J7J8F6_BUGNE|nr:hypothetical protein EB796_019356 [Bugula neritina]
MDVYHMGKPLELAEMVFGATGIGEAKVLTFELFMRVLDVTVKGNKEEKLKFAFDVYDLRNMDQINRSEIMFVLEAMFKLTSKKMTFGDQSDILTRTTAAFDAMDKIKYYAVNFDDFKTAIEQEPWIAEALNINY